MGLDTSHDAFSGAYSAFNRFRADLAHAAGYRDRPSAPLAAPYWDPAWDVIHLNDPASFRGTLTGEWDDALLPHITPPAGDPLLVLLWHSDCDGLIHPREATLLADRLEELLPRLEGTNSAGHIFDRGGNRAVAERLIAGLRKAAAAGEDLEFL